VKSTPRITFEINLRRLPGVEPLAGMVFLTFRAAGDTGRATVLGKLTDAALRARLAHFDAHSANEIAALRRAVATAGGEFSVRETWKDRDACLRHWYGFTGSRFQALEWKCEKCGDEGVERLGRTAGELVYVKCARGHAIAIAAEKPRC
jgi:hypothetical protein